jgi:hypothetical protein
MSIHAPIIGVDISWYDAQYESQQRRGAYDDWLAKQSRLTGKGRRLF